jgi:cytidylate kinase
MYLDTGAMYRAVTLKALRKGADIHDESALAELVADIDVSVSSGNGNMRIFLDGKDVTMAIRSTDVTAAVSDVSRSPSVREKMVELQRRIAKRGHIIVEGRDIGTVVFPEADLKVFMVANLDERAERRRKELDEKEIHIDLHEVKNAIERRDRIDSNRELNPLHCPEDARILDTTHLSVGEQVRTVIEWIEEVKADIHCNGDTKES